ncbi:MAG: HD domain-containing protein [Lachnospiraceae bacterium]|nr:HD domain-containing protein [Lachnospiraceae bacterium]
MIEFLKEHQLNAMLVLSGICGVISLFAAITRTLPKRRKAALIYLELSASILLASDRFAYIYRGGSSNLAYWMVRITNACVFAMSIAIIHAMCRYMCDLCLSEIGIERIPLRLRLVELMSVLGWVLLIIAQFTGIYYTFDEYNRYQRGPLFLLSYLFPMVSLCLMFSVLISYYKKFDKYIRVSILLFVSVPIAATVTQVFAYGLSLTNISIVGMAVVLYVFAIEETNRKVEKANEIRMEALKAERETSERIFEQTITAISENLDERTEYTKGHTLRVARYAREIAKLSGMSDKECFDVYCAALLHDIGKIKVPNDILSKADSLSESEKDTYRNHAEIGGEILNKVTDFPALGQTANYHHERFDGKGYPKGLRGEAIPVSARIIAVADAYDRMASNRNHKGPMAQGKIREIMVAGSGKEFDPKFASIMVDMIDRDTEYVLRETEETTTDRLELLDLTKASAIHFGEYKESVSDGIKLTKRITKISFLWHPDSGYELKFALPSVLIFDALDGCVHTDERNIKNMHYIEYGEIWPDGHTMCTTARNLKSDVTEKESALSENGDFRFSIEAVKYDDHVRVKTSGPTADTDVIMALADSTRFAYIGITGEHCKIEDISISEAFEDIGEDYIPRIAEKISYIDRPEGDMPNIQADEYRSASSEGRLVSEGMKLSFHTKTLPTASSVIHCAYVLLFTSDDGTVSGKNYHEYACIRIDGEDATNGDKTINDLTVHREDSFEGWDAWKKSLKKGLDCVVTFRRRRNRITMSTANSGISIKCVTALPKGFGDVYAALTGEQCVITGIRVR